MAKTKTAGKTRASRSGGKGDGGRKAVAKKSVGKKAAWKPAAAKRSAGGKSSTAIGAAGANGHDVAATMEVANRLVALCREGKNLDAVNSLYDPDIISIEVHGDEHMPARMEGIDAIRGKNQWWLDNHTIHRGVADGPWPHGDRFIVRFEYEVTSKAGPFAGKRMTFAEAALYTVRDGKIVQEEFFYHMGG